MQEALARDHHRRPGCRTGPLILFPGRDAGDVADIAPAGTGLVLPGDSRRSGLSGGAVGWALADHMHELLEDARSNVYFSLCFNGIWMVPTDPREDAARAKAIGGWKSDIDRLRPEAIVVLSRCNRRKAAREDGDSVITTSNSIESRQRTDTRSADFLLRTERDPALGRTLRGPLRS